MNGRVANAIVAVVALIVGIVISQALGPIQELKANDARQDVCIEHLQVDLVKMDAKLDKIIEKLE
jgi:hypothetical protein